MEAGVKEFISFIKTIYFFKFLRNIKSVIHKSVNKIDILKFAYWWINNNKQI